MIYQADTIVKTIRDAIGRSSPAPPLMGSDNDERMLDRHIRRLIEAATDAVHAEAPVGMVADIAREITDDDICWHDKTDEYYSGHIILPDDYLRLVAFEMSDWLRPATAAVTCGDALYCTSTSQYSGIRGTPYKPICAVHQHGAARMLEFQSCHTTDAEITQALYVPASAIDTDDGIMIARRCLQTVIDTVITKIKT